MTHNLQGKTAIVADRHIHMRGWLREQLAQVGVTSVAMSHNAHDLMRKVAASHYDIILCDHQLDDRKDGEEILTGLRASKLLSLKTVFVIITSESSYSSVVLAAEYAPDDYLLKPFIPDILERRLQAAFAKKVAFEEVYSLMEKEQIAAAIKACRKLVDGPYKLDAMRLTAEFYALLHQYGEAEYIYRTVAESRSVPWARLGYAWMLKLRGELGLALDEAQCLNLECPEFITVYDFMSDTYAKAGDTEAAILMKERALAITKDTRRLRELITLVQTVDPVKHTGLLKQLVEKTKKRGLDVKDFLELNKALLRTETADAAEAAVLNNSPALHKNTAAKVALSVAKSQVSSTRGDSDKAVEHLEEAVKYNRLHEETAKLNSELVELAEQLGRTDLIEHLREYPSAEENLEELGSLFDALEIGWQESYARRCRELLVRVFDELPRDKRVVAAHITYNKLAAKYGVQSHKPTGKH